MRGSILNTVPRASMHYWLYIKLGKFEKEKETQDINFTAHKYNRNCVKLTKLLIRLRYRPTINFN